MDVLQFLEREWLRPFAWGVTDCATTADRWFMTVHGYSPMERFGRVVADEETGRAWMDEPGGLLLGIRRVMRRAGIPRLRCNVVLPGDIGVIVVDNNACVSIFDGVTWRSRNKNGVIVADDCHRFIAWEIICRKRFRS